MTTLTIDKYVMPSASLGPDNPLPDLQKNADAHANIDIDRTTVSDEESKYMGWGRTNGILPYTIHNNYNRKKKDKAWKAVILENEYIKATFLPELGARLWSLIDKETGKELLHCNPVFQPCNLALRNAWISGGVEWNLGIIGHTPFTVDSLYAETFTLKDGTPAVRFYQYERVRRLVYRIEAFIPEGYKHLLVRVRIDNTRKTDTAVYWWSNMAVNEGEDIRVMVPSDKAYRYGYGKGLMKVTFPHFEESDGSRTMEIPHALDYFFDIPEGRRHWEAAIDREGYGFCETSTSRLIGRKLFVWGMGAGGRHWQEFLSVKGSKYIELQAGIGHTQLEHLPMKGSETITWMEAYGSIRADGKVVHGEDYNAGSDNVAAVLEVKYPEAQMEADFVKYSAELDNIHGKFVHKADGWAALEQELPGNDFNACGLVFPANRMGEAEKEWEALIKDGALPCPEVTDEPKGYQVSDQWLELLNKSIESGKGAHWYAYYQKGVMLAYRNDTEGAKAAFKKSLELARSPWALRCLAVLDTIDKDNRDLAAGAEKMLEAVGMSKQRNLVTEALQMLNAAGRFEDTAAVYKTLPACLKCIGRIKTLNIEALIGVGRLAEAEKLMMGDIELTDVKEGEVSLTDMWFKLQAMKKYGVKEPDENQLEEIKKTMTPPEHLDFRMK